MELSEFKNFINNIMREFYETEADLLDYQTDDETDEIIHELNISFHISYIILCELKHCDKLKDYKVDTEYNRHRGDTKKLNGRNVRPDILIHKRRTDDYNFAWIEVKKANTNTNTKIQSIEKDRERLANVTRQDGKYRYKYGVLIIIGKDKNRRKIEYYQDGRVVSPQ